MTDTIVFGWLCGLTFVFALLAYWIGKLEARVEYLSTKSGTTEE
jgi:hypothetical protein